MKKELIGRQKKKEDARERVLRIILLLLPEALWSLRVRNKLRRPENPHPNRCYSGFWVG